MARVCWRGLNATGPASIQRTLQHQDHALIARTGPPPLLSTLTAARKLACRPGAHCSPPPLANPAPGACLSAATSQSVCPTLPSETRSRAGSCGNGPRTLSLACPEGRRPSPRPPAPPRSRDGWAPSRYGPAAPAAAPGPAQWALHRLARHPAAGHRRRLRWGARAAAASRRRQNDPAQPRPHPAHLPIPHLCRPQTWRRRG